MSISIGLAQINPTVGAFEQNVQLILQAARLAHQQGVEILLFPELALTGYPLDDLLYREDFIQRHQMALASLQQSLRQLSGLSIVLGHIQEENACFYNAMSFFQDGNLMYTHQKQNLKGEGAFNEARYFAKGTKTTIFTYKGRRFSMCFGDDLLHHAFSINEQETPTLLLAHASPFTLQTASQREQPLSDKMHSLGLQAFYCNLVGGQDESVFDGASSVFDHTGKLIYQAPSFVSTLSIFTLENTKIHFHASMMLSEENDFFMKPRQKSIESSIWQALVLSIKDYCQKNRFHSVVLGLSGGIDSAVVLALAVDALGAEKVRTVMMPSPYTASISLEDAKQMASLLGVKHDELAITPLFEGFLQSLSPIFEGLAPDTTEENLQARIRGTLVMAYSNKFGSLVLTTGNKSELATGYCTLYGDMVGGFAPLKDLPKTLVYRLARWRNQESMVIPERIITRAPSAELRDNQKDQDSLPDYKVLDAILERLVEKKQSSDQIKQAGFCADDVDKVARLLKLNEYKRRQGPVGPKITSSFFGQDWRMPITNGYHY